MENQQPNPSFTHLNRGIAFLVAHYWKLFALLTVVLLSFFAFQVWDHHTRNFSRFNNLTGIRGDYQLDFANHFEPYMVGQMAIVTLRDKTSIQGFVQGCGQEFLLLQTHFPDRSETETIAIQWDQIAYVRSTSKSK
jgi:hypothetical protein